MTKYTFETLLQHHPDLEFLEVFSPDLLGILRGKRLNYTSYPKVAQGKTLFPFSTLTQNSKGLNAQHVTRTMQLGDPDSPFYADVNTLCLAPWYDSPTAVVLGDVAHNDISPNATSCRGQLHTLVQKIKDDLGYTPVGAIELEFYLLQKGKCPLPLPASSEKNNLSSHMADTYGVTALNNHQDFFNDLKRTFAIMDLPSDVYSKEYGNGQFEINLCHCADIVKACDDATLMRFAIREVARKHGYIATFMSKPYAGDVGNGMHVNISLIDDNAESIFAGNAYKHAHAPIGQNILYAIGGLQHTMADCMLLFTNTVNSWKRFMPDSYAPINGAWGVNNRTVGLRIPHSDNKSVRIEHRIAGADANPYLVSAGVLLGMHQGLTETISPTDMTTGDAQYDNHTPLPMNFIDALHAYKQSTILTAYFDKDFLTLYEQVRRSEYDKYHAEVTIQDYNWYLDMY